MLFVLGVVVGILIGWLARPYLIGFFKPDVIKPVAPDDKIQLSYKEQLEYNKFMKQINTLLQANLDALSKGGTLSAVFQLSTDSTERINQCRILERLFEDFKNSDWLVGTLTVGEQSQSRGYPHYEYYYPATVKFQTSAEAQQKHKDTRKTVEELLKT